GARWAGPDTFGGSGRGRGGQAVQDRVDALEAGAKILRLVAEADAQEAVHAEVVAGDDEDALLLAQPRHQLRGVDAPRVTKVRDGARTRGHQPEQVSPPAHPLIEDRVVRGEDPSRSPEDPRPHFGAERGAREPVGESAGADGDVVLSSP